MEHQNLYFHLHSLTIIMIYNLFIFLNFALNWIDYFYEMMKYFKMFNFQYQLQVFYSFLFNK